jgi:hypothetical protein
VRKCIVETYPYVDERQALLYETVRYNDKTFKQRRPDGKGGYIWNLDGVRRVPYRLPERLAAIERGDRIGYCEGEKDVHTAERFGIASTTNAMGVGQTLTGEFLACFQGAVGRPTRARNASELVARCQPTAYCGFIGFCIACSDGRSG